MTTWVWRSGTLFDAAGNPRAVVADGVLAVDGQQLELSLRRTPRFVLKAAGFSLTQEGFSVSRLVGQCPGGCYLLRRLSPFSKKRVVLLDGVVVAEVAPRGAELVVSVHSEAVPLVDLAFLTWGCVLIDLPHLEMRG